MLNVRVAPRLTFTQMLQDESNPSVSRPGPTTADYPHEILIPKIDPGKESAFTFYITNATREVIRVSMPQTAMLETLESKEHEQVPLSTPAENTYLVYPAP